MRLADGLVCTTAAALMLAAPPALAHGQEGYEPGQWNQDAGGPPPGWRADPHAPFTPAVEPGARAAWLADCRERLGRQDSGVGGALIGGVVGGVAGNRIAGRGNRTVGTVAGAAVGAVAGAAIDKAEDRGRNRDECEAYLADSDARYYAGGPGGSPVGYSTPYPASGYAYAPYPAPAAPMGYGYPAGCCGAVPMMMVPVMIPGKPECTETVEYIYEDVPVKRRVYRTVKRTKLVRDKRILIK